MYLILFALLYFHFLSAEPIKVKVHGESAILMNAESGAILFEKKAHEKLYPASTTKIATALFALKGNPNLDERMKIPRECLLKMAKKTKMERRYQDPPHLLEPDGTSYWLKEGEILSLRELLFGVMLRSGNDAANMVAHQIGGSIPQFMDNLNAFLSSIGCHSTHFMNPHGLHHPEHYTTAYDLALLTKEALSSSQFLEFAKTREFLRPATKLQEGRPIGQTNKLLVKESPFYYPRAFGIKTGYTEDAGYCLVAAATEGDRTLIAVTLKCSESTHRFIDVIALFDAAFKEKKTSRVLFRQGSSLFETEIKQQKLYTSLGKDVVISFYPSEEKEVKTQLVWHDLKLPICVGDEVGALLIVNEKGDVVTEEPLYAVNALKGATYAGWMIVLVIPVLLGLLLIFHRRYKKESEADL
ncbi:MAG: D-alanyl-D-alanine carboxypeptidase [Simkaniaceae bacterium]|nr:D-alanyl-D-alanine carboxypeptidase [Simkaniaceae bacterium]